MSIKNCSVSNCVNSNIIGRKRKLFFELPDSEPLRRIWAKTDRPAHVSTPRYFCQDHFDPDDIQGHKLKIFAAPVHNIPEEKSNHLIYTNRRKSKRSKRPLILIKVNESEEENPYILNEINESNDNTQIPLMFPDFNKFESTDHEDSDSTTYNDKCPSLQFTEENDCIITNEISSIPIVIDLSEDEIKDHEDQSVNMIDVILSYEPDTTEDMVEVVLNDTHSVDFISEENCMNTDILEKSEQSVNFPQIDLTEVSKRISDSGTPVVDLTIDEDITINKILGTENQTGSMTPIDLTVESYSDQENTIISTIDDNNDDAMVVSQDSASKIIDNIKRKLGNKYPGTLKKIYRNAETNVLEIEISKSDSFKSNEEFHRHLMEVVDLVQKSKREFPAANTKDKAFERTGTLSEIQDTEVRKLQENLTVNEIGVPKKVARRTDNHFIYLDLDSSSSLDSQPDYNAESKKTLQIVSDYNITQMLQNSHSYLGVSVELFHKIQNLQNLHILQSSHVLVLLLRKIKLNESFTILSQEICMNRIDCINLYNKVLPELSLTLQEFINWPANCKDTVAIADIFEIEIEKPTSSVAQNISFCHQRQRYFVKILICCTLTGYINYVSIPSFAISTEIQLGCLASIANCSTLVINPIMMNYRSKGIHSINFKAFDSHKDFYKRRIQQVFDRMRRFDIMNQIWDLKDINILRHIIKVVVSLTNIDCK